MKKVDAEKYTRELMRAASVIMRHETAAQRRAINRAISRWMGDAVPAGEQDEDEEETGNSRPDTQAALYFQRKRDSRFGSYREALVESLNELLQDEMHTEDKEMFEGVLTELDAAGAGDNWCAVPTWLAYQEALATAGGAGLWRATCHAARRSVLAVIKEWSRTQDMAPDDLDVLAARVVQHFKMQQLKTEQDEKSAVETSGEQEKADVLSWAGASAITDKHTAGEHGTGPAAGQFDLQCPDCEGVLKDGECPTKKYTTNCPPTATLTSSAEDVEQSASARQARVLGIFGLNDHSPETPGDPSAGCHAPGGPQIKEPTLAERCAELVKELRITILRKHGTADGPSLRLPVLVAELARQFEEMDRWINRQVRRDLQDIEVKRCAHCAQPVGACSCARF